MIFDWLSRPALKTYRLQITDGQGNQTYTRVAASNGFDAIDKLSEQLPQLNPGETRNIKCFDCVPTHTIHRRK